MKCKLKINDIVLSNFLGKNEFDSYSEFRNSFQLGITSGVIPLSGKITELVETEEGYKIPAFSDIVFETIDDLISVSLTASLPEIELKVEDQSGETSVTNEGDFQQFQSALDHPPYLYTLTKIYEKGTDDVLQGEEEVAQIKNQVGKAVEEILDIQPEREFFVRLEPDNAENVQNIDPSIFKKFGVIGVLYEKVGNDFKRVYVKSYDKEPTGKAEITTDEREAIKIGWNKSKLFTLTVPDFSDPKYQLRENPVNAEVIAEITRIRGQALESPSDYFKVKGFWQEFPTGSPISLKTFLQGREGFAQIASDTDRVFYAGNLFLRLDGEKIPTNRTPLNPQWKKLVTDLLNHTYDRNQEEVVVFLNNLLSFKGGDVTFYSRGNKIIAYRHSKREGDKIVRVKSEQVPDSEISDLLDYARINVDSFYLNQGGTAFYIKDKKVENRLLSAKEWENFYLEHHTTPSRQVKVGGKPYFFSAKSFLFDVKSRESVKLEEVGKQIENPKIGSIEIVPNEEIELSSILEDLSALSNQVDGSVRESLRLVQFLAQNEKSAKHLKGKKIKFVDNRSKDFKGGVVGNTIEINYAFITDPTMMSSILAHEAIHVFTKDWIQENQGDPLVQRLNKLIEQLPETIAEYYRNPYEILASVANPDIAAQLKSIKVKDKSLFESIIDTLKEIVEKILGVSRTDSVYDELITKIVAISTKEPTQEKPQTGKFGFKKKTVEPLTLGYDEASLNEFVSKNQIDKGFLKSLIQSVDADLASYIFNNGLFNAFITGELNFIQVYRHLHNNYKDETDLKDSFTPNEELFYTIVAQDFFEDYWIENTEFAKVRPSKIKPDEKTIEPVDEIEETENERLTAEKEITDGEDVVNDKFFERTGMEISSIDAADKIARIFVKMIPSVERVGNNAKLYTKEQKEEFLKDNPTQSSYFIPVPNSENYIKFATNSLGRIQLNDYYYTWNTLADKLQGSLSFEEMIQKLETDPTLLKVLPEAYVFVDRLKSDIKNSFDAEVKQKIESSFKRARVGIYVVLVDDNGYHLIDEGKDIFPTAKNIYNTNFLNNLTGEIGKFYNSETGKFNVKKYFESKKNLFREDGELDISKAEGSLGDLVIQELGFSFDNETIWKDKNSKDETYLDFKVSLFKFLSNFENIDIQIADFISTDQYSGSTEIAGLNAKFKKIVKREDTIKPITTSMMVKNAEGENQSVLSLFNSILKDRKYYNDSQTLEELQEKVTRTKNDMFEYSISKSLMFEGNKRTSNKLMVDTLSGKKEVSRGSQSKGKLTTDLGEGEWFLFNYITMMKGGIIENTRAETATTCYGFRFQTWNKNYQQNTPFSITDIEQIFSDGKYNVTSDSYIGRVWLDYLNGELARIRKGGKTFGLFGNILSNELKENIIKDGTSLHESAILKSLSEFFDERLKDYKYYFSLMGGEEALKVLGKETDLSKDYARYKDVRQAWFDLNAMTLHVEETILFQGDISQGWKYFKRAKSVQSTGTPISTSVSLTNWVNNQLEKTSFSKILGKPFQVSNKYRSATIKDDVKESAYFKSGQLQQGYLESKKQYNQAIGVTQTDEEIKEEFKLLSPYEATNIGDGDAFIHPDFYFAVLNLTGSINQDQIKGYKALVYDMRKNALDYFSKEEIQEFGIVRELTEEEEKIRVEGLKLIEKGKVVFPKLKYTQRGPGFKNGETGPVVSEVMDKFALTPLFPQFTKGKPVAKALLKTMMVENIGYTKFESGTKIANFGISDFISKVENGEVQVSLEDSAHELKVEYLAEQIKTPNKVKEKNTFGSQFRKLVQSGLSLVGLDPLIEEWEKANQEFSNLTKQEVLKEFGIVDNQGVLDYSKMNLETVADILLKESKRRDLPENLTVFFDKFKQGKLTEGERQNYYKYFEASLGNQQIQNLLASIVKKIAVQKLSGAQLIQVSSSIFDRKLANKNGKTRELGFYHFKDGKVQAAECKVSMIGDFKNLLNLPEVSDRLEVNGKEDNILNRTEALNQLLLKDEFVEKFKDQLTIVGYRIPTQGLNSMEVMVVREFLPSFYGPTLVCPPEITTQSGTDYDYDKLSVIFPSISEEGQLSENGVKGVQNRMIRASKEILLHPINYYKLITPNSPDYIFNKVKPVLKDLNIQYEEPKGTMVVTLKGNFSKFRTLKSKNLLGVAAVWNTFYSLMQRHKWRVNGTYGILDFKGATLTTSKINPVLLDEKERSKRFVDGQFNVALPNTADGTPKSEVISQLINVTVDMPSDDTFGQTNFDISDFAASIYASSVLGYDYDSILKLWHQPIIYQYKRKVDDLVKQGRKPWMAKLQITSDLLGVEIPIQIRGGFPVPNYSEFEKQLYQEDGILDRFENQLKLESPKFDIQKVMEEPVTNQQRAAFAHYLKLLSQANAIRVTQSALNFDTSPDNNMMKVQEREENYLKAIRIKIVDRAQIDEVKTNSVISGLYTSDILKNIIKRIFPILYSDNNLNFFGQASSNYRDQETAYRLLTSDFLLAVVQSFGTHNGLIFNQAIEFLQGDKSLNLTKEARRIKTKLKKEGLNLRLLDILIVNISKHRPDRVFNQQIFLGFENSPDDKNKITEEFRTLLSREDTKAFAENLALVGLIQSGWSKSNIYFSDLIPEEFVTPIITEALDNYTKLTPNQRKRFRALFYEHFKSYRKDSLTSEKKNNSESYRLMDYTKNLDFIYQVEEPQDDTQDVEFEDSDLSNPLNIVLNKEQQNAIDQAIEFIETGNANDFYIIEGKAGTGKTTIAEKIVKAFPGKTTVVAALSHKATKVIEDKFKQSGVRAKFYTLASLFGESLDLETGQFTDKKNLVSAPPVTKADIILIDEASMVNEEILEKLFDKKPKGAKVIFLGDIGQLPPIRTVENPYFKNRQHLFEKKSPVFDTSNKSRLVTRVRQGEANPILPFADFFWENSQKLNPSENPVPNENRVNQITPNGNLIFINAFADVQDFLISEFFKAIKEKNPNHVKVVTYRNNTRQFINNTVHHAIFGPDANPFEEGELIIFNDSFGEIENATEAQVVTVSPADKDQNGIQYVDLEIVYDNRLTTISVVLESDKKKFNDIVSEKFKVAFAAKGTVAYSRLLQEAWAYKQAFANIDYGYAITSHKSQGSTYNIVVVDEKDILSVGPITAKEKSESIYVGLTRARNTAIVISGTPVETQSINFEDVTNQVPLLESGSLPQQTVIKTLGQLPRQQSYENGGFMNDPESNYYGNQIVVLEDNGDFLFVWDKEEGDRYSIPKKYFSKLNPLIVSNNIQFQEEQSTGYKERTIKNASADATLALAIDFETAGEKLTKSSVQSQGKKYMPINANNFEITQERIDKIVDTLNSIGKEDSSVADIPQNLVSGIEVFGTKQEANAEAKKILGNTPHSIDMIEAGIRTRTTRSVGEMEKYNIKVGDIVKQFGKSADGTTKQILTRVTAIHPKGTPGFLGTWNKEGWTQEGIKAIERYKDGAAAIEFEIVTKQELKEISLNIAGNGIYTMKGKYTQQQVDEFTYQLLKAVIESPKLKVKINSIRTGGQTGFDEAGAKAGIKLGIPTTILAPKGWTFRNKEGQDISDETLFKARFGEKSKGSSQLSLFGYDEQSKRCIGF